MDNIITVTKFAFFWFALVSSTSGDWNFHGHGNAGYGGLCDWVMIPAKNSSVLPSYCQVCSNPKKEFRNETILSVAYDCTYEISLKEKYFMCKVKLLNDAAANISAFAAVYTSYNEFPFMKMKLKPHSTSTDAFETLKTKFNIPKADKYHHLMFCTVAVTEHCKPFRFCSMLNMSDFYKPSAPVMMSTNESLENTCINVKVQIPLDAPFSEYEFDLKFDDSEDTFVAKAQNSVISASYCNTSKQPETILVRYKPARAGKWSDYFDNTGPAKVILTTKTPPLASTKTTYPVPVPDSAITKWSTTNDYATYVPQGDDSTINPAGTSTQNKIGIISGVGTACLLASGLIILCVCRHTKRTNLQNKTTSSVPNQKNLSSSASEESGIYEEISSDYGYAYPGLYTVCGEGSQQSTENERANGANGVPGQKPAFLTVSLPHAQDMITSGRDTSDDILLGVGKLQYGSDMDEAINEPAEAVGLNREEAQESDYGSSMFTESGNGEIMELCHLETNQKAEMSEKQSKGGQVDSRTKFNGYVVTEIVRKFVDA